MSPILIAATTIISLALVAYTIGVFGERNSGTLKRSHLIFFWIGLACDSTGTAIMSSMAQSSGGSISLLHPVTGGLAIALMLFHATWATCVLLRGNSTPQLPSPEHLRVAHLARSLLHRRARGHPRPARCRRHRAGNRFRHRRRARRTGSAQEEAGCFAVRRNSELTAVTGWQRRDGYRRNDAKRQIGGENDGSHHNARCQRQIGETNP